MYLKETNGRHAANRMDQLNRLNVVSSKPCHGLKIELTNFMGQNVLTIRDHPISVSVSIMVVRAFVPMICINNYISLGNTNMLLE